MTEGKTATLGQPEPFTVAREHLLEYALDDARLQLARQKVATAEALMREAQVEVALREREIRATARRLSDTYAGETHVITKPIDLGTGIGERRRIVPAAQVSAPAAQDAPLTPDQVDAVAEATAEKIAAAIAGA